MTNKSKNILSLELQIQSSLKINKMRERVDSDDFIRLLDNYTSEEVKKILEAAEKDNILLFVRVITDPDRKVMRVEYPKKKKILPFPSIPKFLNEIKPGTLLLKKQPKGWKLFRIQQTNDQNELVKINNKELDDALANLSLRKKIKDITIEELDSISKFLPLYPEKHYVDISGDKSHFLCLTSENVTLLQKPPYLITNIKPEKYQGYFSAQDLWISKVEAAEFLGKTATYSHASEYASETTAERNKRFTKRGYEIFKDKLPHKIKSEDIQKIIVNEEKGKTNIRQGTLKSFVQIGKYKKQYDLDSINPK